MLAIDADPSSCLGAALGFPPDQLEKLTLIARMEDLIYDRTGAKPGTIGGYFKLNPRVDDIPDEFSIEHRKIRLLELGAVEMGGAGCICPESAVLRALVTHILLRRDEVVLLDMYAGVEHLGRATADAVETMLVVVEPTARSLSTARQIKGLAEDIGISQFSLVGSKVADADDRAYIEQSASSIPVIGYLMNDPLVREADRQGVAVYDLSPNLAESAQAIAASLEGQRVPG